MSQHDLLALLEEGVQNGRIAPHLATYIAAEVRDRAAGAQAADDADARAARTPSDRQTPLR